MASAVKEERLSIVIKWSGKEYTIDGLSQADTVKQLKELIKGKTGVLPERQKLLGLKYKGTNCVSCRIFVTHSLCKYRISRRCRDYMVLWSGIYYLTNGSHLYKLSICFEFEWFHLHLICCLSLAAIQTYS